VSEPVPFAEVRREAERHGFDRVGVAPAESLHEPRARLDAWLAAGREAGMAWMRRSPEARADPRRLLDGCRSVVVLAAFYPAAVDLGTDGTGRVARYARGRDYHRALGGRAKRFARWLEDRTDAATRVCVDHSPVLERAWAERTGIGWIGKNTNLIAKDRGSWMLLVEVLSAAVLEGEANGHVEHCGTCTACLDACPTQAFPEPWVLDSARCLSYWTIEHRGAFPEWVRGELDGWLFGCDVCQDVCPWNETFARDPIENAFEPKPELSRLDPVELLDTDESTFRERFSGTPLMRARWDGMRRNAAALLADVPGDRAARALERAAEDEDPVVRDQARWALARRSGAGDRR